MPFYQRRRRRGRHLPSHGHRGRALAWSRPPEAREPLNLRLYAASVCSTLTHSSEAWTLTPRALATLNGFNSCQLHREIVSRGHQAFVRPFDGCANGEASLAGPYPADACGQPNAPCGVGAGPTSWPTIPTWQPPDGHAPPTTRTSPGSRRRPRIGTGWPIPLLPKGKPRRGGTTNHHHQHKA